MDKLKLRYLIREAIENVAGVSAKFSIGDKVTTVDGDTATVTMAEHPFYTVELEATGTTKSFNFKDIAPFQSKEISPTSEGISLQEGVNASPGLLFHQTHKKPLSECVFRIGSDAYVEFFAEARELFNEGVLKLNDLDRDLIQRTDIGGYGLFEGENVALDVPFINEEYYQVIANLGDKKAQENLDSFEEVQDFMDQMIKRNAISVDVTKLGDDKKQTIRYNWTGDKWEKLSKSSINEREDALGIYDDGKGNSAAIGWTPYGYLATVDGEYDFQIGPAKTVGELIKMLAAEGFTNKIFEAELGGANTAWEDEKGNKVTLQDILDMTKSIPQKDYPTEKLAKIVLNWDDNPEEVERIEQVKVSKQYPILIMVDEAGEIQWILDGNHRAQKALRSKSKTIPAKLIKPSNLDAKAKKVLLGVVNELNEAEFKGKEVSLNKPKRGGSKAYYVYVKDGDKVKKVSFGSGGLRAKINNKDARSAFAARHNCKNKKDRTTAGYWSCNLPRYAKALGLGANKNTFW